MTVCEVGFEEIVKSGVGRATKSQIVTVWVGPLAPLTTIE